MTKIKKIYSNAEIAEILQNIATAYEIKNKNFFRIRSYQDAADTILTYPKSVHSLWQKDPKLLDDIPGIGPNIFSKIVYLFETGKLHPHIISHSFYFYQNQWHRSQNRPHPNQKT